MTDYTRNTLTGSLAPVNNELEKIEVSLRQKLDRNPSIGQNNEMLVDLDMNGNRIINYTGSVLDEDLVTRGEVSALAPVQSVDGNTGNVVSPVQSVNGQTGNVSIPTQIQIDNGVVFDNVSEMKSSSLEVGQLVRCKRYYSGGELVGGLVYEIQATAAVDGFIDHTLSNNNIAVLIKSDCISPQVAGAKADGSTNDTDSIQATFDSGNSVCMYGDYIATTLTLPDNANLISNNAKITRLPSYTTTGVDLLNVGSDVSILGVLTIDGSDLDLTSDLVNVSGAGVTVEKIIVQNVLKTSGNSHGVVVRNDNFSAQEIEGFRSGYATLRLFPAINIDSFNVERLVSNEHFTKGFVLNGLQEFGHVRIGSYFGRYTGSDAGTDHILVDTQADSRVFNVNNLTIETIDAEGAEANCVKIENVENCFIGSARTRNEGNADGDRASLRMSAKNFTCSLLDVDRAPSITSDASYINTLIYAIGLATYSTYALQYIGNIASLTGVVTHKLDSLICEDHPATGGFVRVQYPDDTRDVFIEITTITSPDQRPFNLTTANKPVNFDAGSSLLIKTLNGYTGIGYAGSSARDYRVQIGNRQYKAFSKPVVGSYVIGDIVYSANPNGLGFLGWVATADIADASVDATDLKTFGAIV